MPIEDIVITELQESGEGAIGANEDDELVYSLEGSDVQSEIKAALLAHAPATVLDADGNEMQRDGGRVVPVNHVAGLWIGRIRYAKNPTSFSYPVPGTPEAAKYSFDTTGGVQHITQSRSTQGSYAASGTAPDFKGAIGVSVNGGVATVDGCDIEVPMFNWEETHVFDEEEEVVTESYRLTLAILTGAVNNDTFRGFAAGTVKFKGARGSRRPNGDWEISFAFSALPNVSGGELLDEPFTVGDITITTKKGWDYLWVYYKEEVETIDSVTYQKKVPAFAYVERVCPYADFDQLNLPEIDN